MSSERAGTIAREPSQQRRLGEVMDSITSLESPGGVEIQVLEARGDNL